jgi:hypothetical protein
VVAIGRSLETDVDVAGFEVAHVERLGRLERVELVLAIPNRDLVAPPELAGNAPVLEVLHPVGVGLGPALRAELDLAGGHRIGGFLDAGILEEPLHRNARLDRHVGALGETDVVLVFLHLEQQAHFLELGRGALAGDEAVEPVELRQLRAVDVRVGVRTSMISSPCFIPISKSALSWAGVIFSAPVPNSMSTWSSAMTGIAACGKGRNTERPTYFAKRGSFGFTATATSPISVSGTGGGDFQELAGRVGEFVLHEIELRALRGHDHLLVGKRGERNRAPVDHPLAAVDQAFLEQLDEHVAHPLRVFRVHGEALARPVAGATEALELVDDDVAVLVLEIPDALEELVAAEVAAGQLFLLAQLALDLRLGGDAGVVGAGQPQHFLAVLARAAGEDVLDRVVQNVAEVQDAGDVRRRNDDRIGVLLRRRIGFETFSVDPGGIPLGFHRLGFIGFRKSDMAAEVDARGPGGFVTDSDS